MTIRTLNENEIAQVTGGALATQYVASTSSFESLTSAAGLSSKITLHKVICAIKGGVGPISCMSVIPVTR